MKIAIIHFLRQPPFAGPTRVYINFSKNRNIHLLFYDINKNYLEYYNNILCTNRNIFLFSSKKELINFIISSDYNYIVIDDFYKKLTFGSNLKKYVDTNIIVYTQVYHGTAKTCLTFKNKFIQYIISNLLKKFDNIVCNSKTGLTLLRSFYKISFFPIILGYVYPPVDTNIFYPKYKEKENSVLIFIGSGFDTNLFLVSKILDVLINNREKIENIYLLGNYKLQLKLKSKFRSKKIVTLKGVSDTELAEIYSKSMLTICPQKWEPFGYVVAESIACETPVLSFNQMGPKELIEQTKFGILVDTEEEFLYLCRQYQNISNNLLIKKVNINRLPYSIENSTKKFLKIVKGGTCNG